MNPDPYMVHVQGCMSEVLLRLMLNQPLSLFKNEKSVSTTTELFNMAFEKGESFGLSIFPMDYSPEKVGGFNREVLDRGVARIEFFFELAPQVQIDFKLAVDEDGLTTLQTALRELCTPFEVQCGDMVVPLTQVMSEPGDWDKIFVCEAVVCFGTSKEDEYRLEIATFEAGSSGSFRLIQ